MNSFFASVEQQCNPDLRGRPVAVVPVLSDTTSCIAASYEAKAYGIRTGTNVGEAKVRCPEIKLVTGEHDKYREYHDLIVKAVGRVLPVDKVLSVDEMVCRLYANEQSREVALALGRSIKESIYNHAGDYLKCSVGVGPSTFIAKMAAELKKPDGLVALDTCELPGRLLGLTLLDFPGINKRMLRRFQAHGVYRVEQMYSLSKADMKSVFGGITGERWFLQIHGAEVADIETERKTVGHSYVMPPEMRTASGASTIARRLLERAAERLRSLGYHARTMDIYVTSYDDDFWKTHLRFDASQDLWTLMNLLKTKFDCPVRRPVKVAITLGDLIEDSAVTPSLFAEERQRHDATKAMDEINRKFGRGTIWPGSVTGVRLHARDKIAFSKVSDLPTLSS
jgi:DNA polymerase-4